MACNQKTEVYSRIVGYYRPVQQWNKGKKAEFFRRKTYKVTLTPFQQAKTEKEEECKEAV